MHIKEAIQALFPGCYSQINRYNGKDWYEILIKHSKGGIAHNLGRGETEDEAWAGAAVKIQQKFKSW